MNKIKIKLIDEGGDLMASKNKKARRDDLNDASRPLDATSRCPLVSVIIPMYNATKFIPQTLESLLYQTMQDFEVIVIDDCSTDEASSRYQAF